MRVLADFGDQPATAPGAVSLTPGGCSPLVGRGPVREVQAADFQPLEFHGVIGCDHKRRTAKSSNFRQVARRFTRGKKWVTLLLLLDLSLALLLIPWSLAKLLDSIPKDLLPETLTLPDSYTPVFLAVVGTVFVAALIVAYRTVPRGAEASVGPTGAKRLALSCFQD